MDTSPPPWAPTQGNPQNVNPLSGLITVIQQMVKGQQQLITALAALTTATAASTTAGGVNTTALVTAIDTVTTAINTKFPDWVAVPATAASAGVSGQVAYQAGFLYVCVAANTWQRVVIATF